ncbi:hypothetical protein ACIQRW_28715 [Streptomyces sp. NPDC091287]|uniref:hypothetical protein n=1 Tax=Streptomyces sp. NPDC091287 TaxID=3365988 RepID=UPI00382F62FD
MRALVRWHPALMITAGLMVVVSLFHAVGIVVDDRMYGQSPAWIKPLKFSLSFIVYTAWLGALVHLLEKTSGSLERKARRFGNWIVVAVWAEMFFLDLQTIRGTTVHFNFRTIPDAVIFESVGAIATTLVVINLLLVAVVLKKRAAAPPVLLALKIGTWLLVASSLVGIYMAFPTEPGGWSNDVVGAHSVDADIDHDVTPVIFWAAEGGDLRVSHFIGLHAFQLLPLIAMFLSRWVDRRMVWVLGAGYTAVFLISLVQALAGEAPFEPSAPTLIAGGAVLVGTLAGVVWARRNPSDAPPISPAPERAAEPESVNL